MKKIVFGLTAIALIGFGCAGSTSQSGTTPAGTPVSKEAYIKPAYPITEAKKIIENYVKGMHKVSRVEVYEGKKYYIGAVYLEGYPNDVVRKVYLSKKDKSILLPTMAETFDYQYMLKAEKENK